MALNAGQIVAIIIGALILILIVAGVINLVMMEPEERQDLKRFAQGIATDVRDGFKDTSNRVMQTARQYL